MRALWNRRARRRWVFLVLGGALLMPYWLVGAVVSEWLGRPSGLGPPLSNDLILFACLLPAVAVTPLVFPMVRVLEVLAARELLGVPLARPDAEDRSWPTRWRTAAWFSAHLGVGAVMSGLSLAMPPLAVTLLIVPVLGERVRPLVPEPFPLTGWQVAWAPVAGLAVLAGLVALVVAAGALLTRAAQPLLGPSPTERMAALGRRADRLAQRNLLARDLHDSVGHALSVVTVQAGAAARVLDTDPDFARRALDAIAEVARAALDDLDDVLGLLRDGAGDHPADSPGPGPGDSPAGDHSTGDRSPARTLADLDHLLALSGVPVDLSTEGSLAAVPALVSRAAYRIVQEGLSNAVRHAGAVPVTLRLRVRPDELEIQVFNGVPADRPAPRPGGGRGLAGVRERVTVLGGRMRAGAVPDGWLLEVGLPWRTR